MESCGGFACATEFTDGTCRIVNTPCKQRCCPTCSAHHGRTVAEKVSNTIRDIDVIRFLTLTIQSSELPLADQITHLWDSYRRLRQSKMWKQTQDGAIAVMEVTLNLKTWDWHPHLHVVLDGSYVHQTKWSEHWERASGGSKIVDIRMIPSRECAAKYLGKYLGKQAHITKWRSDKLVEFINAMHGRRLLNTCGTLRKLQPVALPEDDAKPTPTSLAQRGVVMRLYDIGSPTAAKVVEILRDLGGVYSLAYELRPSEEDQITHPNTNRTKILLCTLLRKCVHENAYWSRHSSLPPPPTPPPPLASEMFPLTHHLCIAS